MLFLLGLEPKLVGDGGDSVSNLLGEFEIELGSLLLLVLILMGTKSKVIK